MNLQVLLLLLSINYSIQLKVTGTNSFNMERGPVQANRKTSAEIRRVSGVDTGVVWGGGGDRRDISPTLKLFY